MREVEEKDTVWVREGISEYIFENWEEFNEVVEQTRVECASFFSENGVMKPTDIEVIARIKTILKQKIGKYETEFETAAEDIEIVNKILPKNISEIVYECVCNDFSLADCVLFALKEKNRA